MDQTQAVGGNVKAIIAQVQQVPKDQVRRECRFKEDLGADSLDLVRSSSTKSKTVSDSAVADEDAKQLATVEDTVPLALRLLGRA